MRKIHFVLNFQNLSHHISLSRLTEISKISTDRYSKESEGREWVNDHAPRSRKSNGALGSSLGNVSYVMKRRLAAVSTNVLLSLPCKQLLQRILYRSFQRLRRTPARFGHDKPSLVALHTTINKKDLSRAQGHTVKRSNPPRKTKPGKEAWRPEKDAWKKPTELLDLHPEIRFQILENMFSNVKVEDWQTVSPASIIFTCKTFYVEARELALDGCTYYLEGEPNNRTRIIVPEPGDMATARTADLKYDR